MKRAPTGVSALVIAAALAGASPACRSETPKPAVPEGAPPRPVATAVVQALRSAGTVPVPALVQANQRAVLASRVSASVIELPWREGDRVGAGAVVARLDDAALRSALAAAESAARAADLDRTRFEALLAKGAATPREVEESVARAAASRAAVAMARENLAYVALRAPFAGTIASRPARVGDVVSPGAAVIEVEGDSGLEALATVDAASMSRLRPGVSVEVLVDGQPGPLQATVRAIAQAGDPATHRFEVRADLPRSAGLRSGLFARLLAPAAEGPATISVPASAVFARGGLTGVFVVADGVARLRWVAAGVPAGGLVEIRAGLEAGERVALDPAGLADGIPVVNAAAEPR
jgi:membrane fusion protein, multidrug efflux system